MKCQILFCGKKIILSIVKTSNWPPFDLNLHKKYMMFSTIKKVADKLLKILTKKIISIQILRKSRPEMDWLNCSCITH